ncbi:MAG: peptidylprolyl isomerase [Anaerolineales bacterium]|nr:peptidylprolyl isomerase [Anaerolineales bacterium]
MALGLVVLVGCTPTPEPTAVSTATATFVPTATTTPLPPTATPEPLAARVNGQPILLADYEAELQRCQAAQAFSDCAARVLQSLTEQAVVEQAAVSAGLSVTEAAIELEINRVREALGAEGYAAWLAANFYTEASFREAVRRDLLRAQMGATVRATVGDNAEQARARLILVAEETTARELMAQLQAGADFATLAAQNSVDLSSRVAGGDLGWFPRGWLTLPEVEQAAFTLETGQTSEVLATELGFAIVRAEEREAAHPLSPEAAEALRQNAYTAWLQAELAKATIETFVSP